MAEETKQNKLLSDKLYDVEETKTKGKNSDKGKCAESGDQKTSGSTLNKDPELISTNDAMLDISVNKTDDSYAELGIKTNLKKHLDVVAQNAEKLVSYYESIKNENNEHKQQVSKVMKKFDKFSERLETLTDKTSKIIHAVDDENKKNIKERKSLINLKLKKPKKLEIESSLVKNKSDKHNSEKHYRCDTFCEDKESTGNEIHFKKRKYDPHHKDMLLLANESSTGNDFGAANPESFQNVVEYELKELRKCYEELKLFVNGENKGFQEKSVGLSKNDLESRDVAKIVHDSFNEAVSKALNETLHFELENINKRISALDQNDVYNLDLVNCKLKNYKNEMNNLELMIKKQAETLSQKAKDADEEKIDISDLINPLSGKIEKIEKQIEEISENYQIVNELLCSLKQNIIDLSCKLKEMADERELLNLVKNTYPLNSAENFRITHRGYKSPLNKVLGSIEATVEKVNNHQKTMQLLPNLTPKEVEENKTGLKNTDVNSASNSKRRIKTSEVVDSVNQKLIKNLSHQCEGNIEKMQSGLSGKYYINPLVGDCNSKPQSDRRRSQKRTDKPQTLVHGRLHLNATSQQRQSKELFSQVEDLAPECIKKTLSEKNNLAKKSHKSFKTNSIFTQNLPDFPLHLLVSNPNLVSDIVGKELDKRFPEIIKVDRIPKILDQIASKVIPLSNAVLQQKCSDFCRYDLVKRRSESSVKKGTKKNISERKQTEVESRNSDANCFVRFETASVTSQTLVRDHRRAKGSIEKVLKSSSSLLDLRRKSLKILPVQKEVNFKVYSKEFLSSVKQSFKEMVTSEIQKSLSTLITDDSFPAVTALDTEKLLVSSLEDMKATQKVVSEEIEKIEKNSDSLTASGPEEISNLKKDMSSRTFSAITLDHFQKSVSIIDSEKNLRKNYLSSVKAFESSAGPERTTVEIQTEYNMQRANTAAPGYTSFNSDKVLDTFIWNPPGWKLHFSVAREKQSECSQSPSSSCICSDSVSSEQSRSIGEVKKSVDSNFPVGDSSSSSASSSSPTTSSCSSDSKPKSSLNE